MGAMNLTSIRTWLAAFPLLAVQFTRSPTAVAAVTAVQGLPWLLAGTGLGVLLDRTDRRRLMVIVDIVQAVVIALLAVAILAHGAGLLLVYLTAFVTGLGAASVFRPSPASRQIAAPRLSSVRRDAAECIGRLWHHSDIRDLTVAVGVISAMDAAWFAVLVLHVTQSCTRGPAPTACSWQSPHSAE
jgi:MFS family permease